MQAERLQAAGSDGRLATYRRVLELQQRAFDLVDPLTRRVAIPFEGTTLPAYFTRAPAADHARCP